MVNSKRTPILQPPQLQEYAVNVDSAHCDGCKLCIQFCPKEVLGTHAEKVNSRMLHYAVATSPDNCTGCRQCERICPTASIFIKDVEISEDLKND